MKIEIVKQVEVEAKTLNILIPKSFEGFDAILLDENDEVIYKYIGEYVGPFPAFFPGNDYVDFVILNVDIDTGKIANWTPPTREQLEEWINGGGE